MTNSYASSEASTFVVGATSADTADVALLQHFAQAPYYANAFAKLPGAVFSLKLFNWAAVFFGLKWCFPQAIYYGCAVATCGNVDRITFDCGFSLGPEGVISVILVTVSPPNDFQQNAVNSKPSP